MKKKGRGWRKGPPRARTRGRSGQGKQRSQPSASLRGRQGASGPPCKCFEFPKQEGEAKSCRVPPHAKKDKGHPCTAEARAGAQHPGSLPPISARPRFPRDAQRRGDAAWSPPPPSGLALIIAGERDCGGAGQGWVPGVGLAVAPQAGPTWGRWVGCTPTGTARSRARGDSAHGKAPSSPSWQSGSFTAHAPTGTCFLQGPNLLEKP